jgi:response regulator RpfG family c-di-GMP phosphodiesterase
LFIVPRLSTHSSSGHTILVVDDNPLVLESLRYLFEREGHGVLIADNGRAALEICQQSAVHVMVLDFNMPGLTGGETVKKLREFNTDTQVILQTGQSLIPAREMLRELEIQGYHDKSEGAEKLMLWVDAALKSYRQAHTQKTLEGSFLALGLALEMRDLETAGHTQHVVRYATALGEAFGLSSLQLEALRQGAYLHDLGKLGVPDGILLKPGKLNPEEWSMMKTHVERGFQLASQIPGLAQGALNVIRYHHERFDGSGYPEGLQGEDIPLEARVFAICDVYDALVSIRPYKRAWTHEEALAQLRMDSGRHFDPSVVTAFIETLESNSSEKHLQLVGK